MALSEIHNVFAITANATHVGGIINQRAFANSQLRGEPSDGSVFPPVVHMFQQNPGGSFTTRDIKGIIDLLDATHTYYTFTGAGFKCYGYKHAEGGTRAGATSHRVLAAALGMLVPRRITAQHRQVATLDFDAIIAYNGSANPWVITDNQTLPTGITDTGRWTIGPVTIESVVIDALRSVEIDWGIEARTEGADSDLWDRSVSVFSAQPRIMLRGINIKKFIAAGGVPLTGLAATHANTTIYLRKYAPGGATYVADVTEEHISIKCNGLIVPQDLQAGPNGQPQEVSFELKCRHDGTNNPLVIDTTAAIS